LAWNPRSPFAQDSSIKIITDDNMGQEWIKEPAVNWH